MNISKLKVMHHDKVLAYYYQGDIDWRDPYGGVFSDREMESLDMFARGETDHVIISEDTMYSRIYYPRLVADIG